MKSFLTFVEASESKINYLSKTYNLDKTDIISLDNLDPTNSKFLEWLVKRFIAKQFREEDFDQIQKNLKEFETKRFSKDWDGPKDINKFKTVSELSSTLRKNREVYSKTEISSDPSKAKGNTILNSDGDFTLWKIEDYNDFQLFKVKDLTEWCVAYPDQWFNYYPPFYMVTKKLKPYALLHIKTLSCMDVEDSPISPKIFKNLGLNLKSLISSQYRDITMEHLVEFYGYNKYWEDWLSLKELKILSTEILAIEGDGYFSRNFRYNNVKIKPFLLEVLGYDVMIDHLHQILMSNTRGVEIIPNFDLLYTVMGYEHRLPLKVEKSMFNIKNMRVLGYLINQYLSVMQERFPLWEKFLLSKWDSEQNSKTKQLIKSNVEDYTNFARYYNLYYHPNLDKI